MATYFIDGRLTRDAEMKSTKDGKSFCRFSIAWNRGDKKPVHYYNCTMNGERASKLIPYLKQGKYVVVVGEPDWNEWEGKTYETIRVDKLTFVGNSTDTGNHKPYEYNGQGFSTREELDAYKKANPPQTDNFDDDDIPW